MARSKPKEQDTDTFQVSHAVHVERDPATMNEDERLAEIERLFNILYLLRNVVGKPLELISEQTND